MSISTAGQFYEQLEHSKLLTAEELAELHGEVLADYERPAQALADDLVQRRLITSWQARQMISGRHAFFVGKYKLLERLGTGGMGTVYKAYHPMTDRVVAIKLVNKALLANPPAVARFRTEVRLICSLNHPNIITAYDADSVGDLHFLVMEFGPGHDLRTWLKDFAPLPVAWACDCIRQAALALDHAHGRGLVHRDIKPENILAEGADPTVPPQIKLLDLGLARLMHEAPAEDAELTGAGRLMGTPDYISPEQATEANNADIRSDIYSLGATFYRILTGEPPFEGGDVRQRVMARLLADAPRARSRRPDLPEEVDAIVARMLARSPDDRYQTPAEVAEALFPFTYAGEKVTAKPGKMSDNLAADSALGNFFNRLSEERAVAVPRPNVSPPQAKPLVVRARVAPVPVAVAPIANPFPSVAPATGPAPEPVATPAAVSRPSYDRRNLLMGIGVGVAMSLPIVITLYWLFRPATVLLQWPLDQRGQSQLLIDGEPKAVPRTDPAAFTISPGKHRLVLRRRGYDPIEWNVDLKRGGRVEKRVEWQETDLSRPFTLQPAGG